MNGMEIISSHDMRKKEKTGIFNTKYMYRFNVVTCYFLCDYHYYINMIIIIIKSNNIYKRIVITHIHTQKIKPQGNITRASLGLLETF